MVFVSADRNIINTILRNLLGNSVKFTNNYGTIIVNAKPDKDEVIVSVKDSGIGIPKAHIKDLFKIDTKYTRPGTNMEQGTGLGLKVTKEFVEIQGGKIWVKSTVNKGSEFCFSVPLETKKKS